MSHFFKDFIALNDYKINFVGMFSDSREFVVAFNEENSGNDDLSDTIISFKVRHNHGNYKINHVSIHDVHKINLNVNTFFMVEPVFEHVV